MSNQVTPCGLMALAVSAMPTVDWRVDKDGDVDGRENGKNLKMYHLFMSGDGDILASISYQRWPRQKALPAKINEGALAKLLALDAQPAYTGVMIGFYRGFVDPATNPVNPLDLRKFFEEGHDAFMELFPGTPLHDESLDGG